MNPARFCSRRRISQRGTSLLGLFMIAVLVGFVGLVATRTFPSINEYLTIRKAVSQIMRSNPSSPAQIRSAFQKQKEIEYSISSISEKDLQITPVNNRFRTRFAYQVEIPLIEPVFLLVKYEGEAMSGAGAAGL